MALTHHGADKLKLHDGAFRARGWSGVPCQVPQRPRSLVRPDQPAPSLSSHYPARALLDKCQVFNSISARIDFNQYVRVMMFRTKSTSEAGSVIGDAGNFAGSFDLG